MNIAITSEATSTPRRREVDMKKILYPIISFSLFLAAWAGAIAWFEVPPYLVPSPEAVGYALWIGLGKGLLYPHIWATLSATVTGYVIGCAVGLLGGALTAEFEVVDRLVRPYIIALQSIPKVALAPLMIVWFGYGLSSKVVMVALMCFFPVFVNTVAGMQSANPALIDLYRVSSASRFSILLNVKLPTAATSIFAGLEVAVVLALIGAIVGEFISSTRGLGNLIQSASTTLDVSMMFAAVAVLAVIGVVASQLLRWLHKRVVFWERSSSSSAVAAQS
jgi:NitT/TauT family transport system permease protein